MYSLRIVVVCAFLLLSFAITAQAEEFVGGYGTNWVGSALTLPPGAAMLSGHSQFWTGDVSDRRTTVSSVAGNLHFGYSRKLEIGISQVLFQDVNWANSGLNSSSSSHISKKYMTPGDLAVSLKLGSLPTTIGQLYILHSFSGAIRYRVGQMSSLPLYPYFGHGIAGSFQWNASWYSRPLYPDESEFLGLSVTGTNHNDVGSIAEATTSVQVGLAYSRPATNLNYGAQIHSMFFRSATQGKYLQSRTICLLRTVCQSPGYRRIKFDVVAGSAALQQQEYNCESVRTEECVQLSAVAFFRDGDVHACHHVLCQRSVRQGWRNSSRGWLYCIAGTVGARIVRYDV